MSNIKECPYLSITDFYTLQLKFKSVPKLLREHATKILFGTI